MTAPRVLVGSPVKQKPAILGEFLRSLVEMDTEGLFVDYIFIDDNDVPASSSQLAKFCPKGGTVIVWSAEESETQEPYVCDDKTHWWNYNLVWRVATHKNRIIDLARSGHYDFLFLLDSDLVLHPDTLHHLVGCRKPIVSEVFWTKWDPATEPLPQVWLRDVYTLFENAPWERLTQEGAQQRAREFLQRLRVPGLYEVGGLGACTLIAREALDAGVSFSEIPNLSFWGEDRHFCIRAAALGLKLFVDTCYPAYHIYREADLEGLEGYRRVNCTGQRAGPHDAAVALLRSGSVYREIRRVLDVTKEAVERFWSFDFRDPRRQDGIDLFAQEYRDEIVKRLEADLDESVRSMLISRTEVLSSSLADIDSDTTEALVTAQVVTHGLQHGEYFRELYDCRALVTRPGTDRKWLVRGVEFTKAQQPGAPAFVRDRLTKYEGNKLTLSMLVRNEAGRYLRQVLEHAAQYIDNAVVLDDASEDETVEVCRQALGGIPVTIVSNSKPGFHNEVALRKRQWDLVVSTNPDWILVLDADEMLEDRAKFVIRDLINQPFYDHYSFRLYDFWDPTHYRDDPYWRAHKTYRVFLVRYQPRFKYTWRETALHCGRLPNNIGLLPGRTSDLRVKHFGWASPADREAKYQRYRALDPSAKYGIRQQYESILDRNPNLVEWIE
ncbi:MAG: glycosyltransferase family 2 protein [Bacillota bacterium]